MKKLLTIALLLFCFSAHAETLPEPSIDTEPRGCGGTPATQCQGWIFAYQKWMDDNGNRHNYSQVYIDKKKDNISNIGAAYELAKKKAMGQ